MRIEAGGAVAIVATGPSVAAARLEQLEGTVATIAVNDAWRLTPWAFALYACDRQWWEVHGDAVAAGFNGECWTQDAETARARGIRHIPGDLHKPGLSADPALIHCNAHSGAQAINLAVHWGARRLILVGFDMAPDGRREHYFGPHPRPLRNGSPYQVFLKKYPAIAKDLQAIGAEVWNASPRSALTLFPRVTLEDALCRALSS